MCSLIEGGPEDKIYRAYVKQIYEWIHWRVRPSWDDMLESLRFLEEFYLQEQTEISRAGILSLLGQIRREREYQNLVMLQKELIQIWIKFDGTYAYDPSGEGPYTFFSFLYKEPLQAMEVLERATEIYHRFGSNTHCILERLFRMGSFVTSAWNLKVSEGKFMDFFLRRSLSFLGGMDIVRHQIETMRGYDAGSLVPTDGDLHCDGKVPVIVSLSGKNYVYKPRDMRIDSLVTEAFAYCSQFLAEEMQLPSLQVHLLPDHTGLMEFAFHVGQMSREEAEKYFIKLGVLLCFAKLFGVRDLHYENMMATLQGPVIIDMECALSAEAIQSERVCDESLSILRTAFAKKEAQNATFAVEGEIPSLKEWAAQIHQGFVTAADCLNKHKRELVQYYRGLFEQPLYYRIVPVKTETFYESMYAAVMLYNKPDQIEQSLQAVYQMIFDVLYTGFSSRVSKAQFARCIKKNFLMQMIYLNLFHGNIPLLQMEVARQDNGRVLYTGYINGFPFFEYGLDVTSVDCLCGAFETQVKWLNSKQALQSLHEFIGQ